MSKKKRRKTNVKGKLERLSYKTFDRIANLKVYPRQTIDDTITAMLDLLESTQDDLEGKIAKIITAKLKVAAKDKQIKVKLPVVMRDGDSIETTITETFPDETDNKPTKREDEPDKEEDGEWLK